VFVISGKIVGDTTLTAMKVRPAQILGTNLGMWKNWGMVASLFVQITSSPVAAFTSGGPAKNTVPLPCTITDWSHIAGTYAPPAVQDL
jgi:hypothetical protein